MGCPTNPLGSSHPILEHNAQSQCRLIGHSGMMEMSNMAATSQPHVDTENLNVVTTTEKVNLILINLNSYIRLGATSIDRSYL